MVADGALMIVTGVVAITAEHPPAAGIVYVTVYNPGMLVLGSIAPVIPSMFRPVGDTVYVPPEVPVSVTA